MKRKRSEEGFSLAALIVIAAIASVMIASAIPVYQMRAQRERETELIFRGEEYARAILKYQRKFNTDPPSIDALLGTNGIRFLRRQYKDPISGEDFRLLTVNPDGSINGSTTTTVASAQPLVGNGTQSRPGGTGTGQNK